MKWRKRTIADMGHKGEFGMVWSGTWTRRSRNWTVLIHLNVIATPKVKSDLRNYLSGSKAWIDVGSTWDFRKRPENKVRQIAQKVASEPKWSFRRGCLPNKMSLVMGSFLCTERPWRRLTPLMVLEIFQLSLIGFGRSCSLCNRLTILRYCGIHWGFSLLVR